jgi:hypothetical protein
MTSTKQALDLIRKSKSIIGYNTSIGETLHIDYINKEPQDDDIVICGNNCTIFLEDLEDSFIVGKTIFINNRYAIHTK